MKEHLLDRGRIQQYDPDPYENDKERWKHLSIQGLENYLSDRSNHLYAAVPNELQNVPQLF
ncbi:MAG: hypothetical protein HYS08_03765 [Chlamydiae bacterium]|nr:hypothetical protein [Chlamydiota bacterium]MBI3266913.1 hypothetical protein [Chlamydiota bacterium]